MKGRVAEDYQPEMPPVTGAGYLLGHLFEVGPVLQGAMGPVRLTNQELLAWQTTTGIRLAPWESRFLVRLSHEYLVQSHKSEKRDEDPPWVPEEVAAVDLAEVSDSLRDAIRAMAKKG